MGHKDSKQVVYRYNGDPKSEQVEFDLDGEIPIPPDGQLIMRNGKNWKVAASNTETTVTGPQAIPVLRIYLTDQI